MTPIEVTPPAVPDPTYEQLVLIPLPEPNLTIVPNICKLQYGNVSSNLLPYAQKIVGFNV